LPTLAIVIVTAVAGTWLVRSQGAAALSQLRGSFNELRDPTEPLAHGAMILFAGALLLTPGFFTDAVGFALLVPRFRDLAIAAARRRMRVQSAGFRGAAPGAGTVEGEWEEIADPAPSAPRRPGASGWTRD